MIDTSILIYEMGQTVIENLIDYFENKDIEKTGLNFENNYQLLVAIILSARCKDSKVNEVSKNLFHKFPNFSSLARANIDNIKEFIKSITYPNEKAKRLKKLGEIMVGKFDNEIPKDLETLITLPGVGRKTANVYLATVYDLPNIAVDTHVRRVANRLQLVHSQDPKEIEFELYKLFPQRYHNKVSSWLIDFGRNICKARGYLCGGCPFKNFCVRSKKLS